ncbi:MAG: phage holin [Lachnospiraceae bacterium]|nr:phage holin [Lachnospiraceae bacterium]
MKMSNKVYDVLKFVAQILLPAIGTLYFALARIWDLPYAEQIVGTITAVDAFLGALLGISTMQYKKAAELQPPDED